MQSGEEALSSIILAGQALLVRHFHLLPTDGQTDGWSDGRTHIVVMLQTQGSCACNVMQLPKHIIVY